MFGYSLEHKYSENSLKNGLAALKGKDRLMATSLKNANDKLPENERFSLYIGRKPIDQVS